jgi:hypothetical protein
MEDRVPAGDEEVSTVCVQSILDLYDPTVSPPWNTSDDLTLDMVLDAIDEGRYQELPIEASEYGSAMKHAERIAYLFEHKHLDPLSVELPSGAFFGSPFDDGNHRFYAAVLRGDETVNITFSGFIDNNPFEIISPEEDDLDFR